MIISNVQAALIAPILFLTLLIAFPIIGAIGGWKRAAYWGGGNFVFYVIGLLIWKFNDIQIGNGFTPLISKILTSWKLTPEEFEFAIHPLSATIFFLLILLIGNIILIINYYCWFKKVSGIKKDVKIKKLNKLIRNNNCNLVQINNQSGSNLYLSNKNKIINACAGAVGLSAMLMPNLLTTTATTYFLTSTTASRKQNKFVDGLYNSLESFNNKISWFSYYSKQEGIDLNAGFCALNLMINKLNIQYTYPSGGSTNYYGNIGEILEKILPQSLSDIFNELQKNDEEINYQRITDDLSNLAKSINEIITIVGLEIIGFMNSQKAGNLVLSEIKNLKIDKTKITTEMLRRIDEQKLILECLLFLYSIIQEKQKEEVEIIPEDLELEIFGEKVSLKNIVTFKQIETNQESKNKIDEAINCFLDSSEIKDMNDIKTLNNTISKLTSLIFKIKKEA